MVSEGEDPERMIVTKSGHAIGLTKIRVPTDMRLTKVAAQIKKAKKEID